MEETIKKIIEVSVSGDRTVKSLKEEINLLRDALLNVEQGSDNYKKILEKLIDDQKQLTSVMSAGKKEVTAAAGSYNALQQEMTALRKVWREVTDEASRAEIGQRILEINNQLKEMDASIGVFNRNVGDYTNSIVDASKQILGNLGQISPELGKLGSQINSLIPLIQKTTKVATTGLKGVKAAIASTGIGALIIALGLLVSNWEKVSDAIANVLPWMKKVKTETEAQVKANDELIKSNKAATEEMDFQARIMAAQGKSALEILNYKKQETEAILENTNAQIKETEAKIAALKVHSAFGRWIRGERKELKALEESLASLVEEQKNLKNSVTKFGQDIVVETVKANTERTKAEKKGAEERIKIALQEANRKYGIIKGWADKTKELEKNYYTESEKLAKENEENIETITKGLYGNLYKYIKNSNLQKALGDTFDGLREIIGKNKNLGKQINDIWEGIDWTASTPEIFKNLKDSLANLDLTGVSKTMQDKLKKFADNIKLPTDMSKQLKELLDAAFANVDFEDTIIDIKALFPNNAEIQAILDEYLKLYKDNQKAIHTETVTREAETLTAIRNLQEKNAEETINLELRKKNALRGNSADDRIQALEDALIAENRIYAERKKNLEEFIKTYQEIANDENVTDEQRKQAAADVAQAQIELQNLVTEKTISNMEKQKEIQEQQIANTKEMINQINDFANSIGNILGSIADYWQDYVEGQVKAGKMSKKEGERQFKWIKTMQIAQTTIQTLAAAMAAFNGITSATGGWGVAAAAAEMAAVLATGAIQIAKIKATTLESEASNNVSQGAQIRTITTDFQPNYVAAQTGQSETDNLANAVSQQPIYVNVVEIEDLMDKRTVRATESTF